MNHDDKKLVEKKESEKQKYGGFLHNAYKIGQLSKDQSTKVGSIYLNKRETLPSSFGYNGMPRGLNDSHEERNQRPEKYFWSEHSERNNIYNMAREILENTTIFVTKHPNMESARAIVSCGIKTVIVEHKSERENNLSIEDRKMDERVTQLFVETGVEFIKINREEVEFGFSPYDNNDSKEESTQLKLKELNLKEKYLTFLDMTKDLAEANSPDHDEKHAAMILNSKTFAPIEDAFGVYAPPEGISLTEEMKTPEEKKYWFQEAEINAICNAVHSIFVGKTLISDWCPCINCGLAIVAVGTKKVVTREPDFTKEADLRWKDSFERSSNLFNRANIELVLLDIPKPENIITEKKKNKKKM